MITYSCVCDKHPLVSPNIACPFIIMNLDTVVNFDLIYHTVHCPILKIPHKLEHKYVYLCTSFPNI